MDGVGNHGIRRRFLLCFVLRYISRLILNVCSNQICSLQSVSYQYGPYVQFDDSSQTSRIYKKGIPVTDRGGL
jgi:hypothetical protein